MSETDVAFIVSACALVIMALLLIVMLWSWWHKGGDE